MRQSTLALLLLALPAAAFAHPGHGHGGFGAGFLHPLLGLDHLLAMTGIGFWAARHGSLGQAAIIAGSFLVAVLAGFGIGLVQGGVSAVEFGILASLAITGVLVFGARRLSLAASAGLAGLFAVFHGHAHGAEMAASLSAVAFMSGFALTTVLLLVAGATLAIAVNRRGLLRPADRLAGGVLVASAAYLLVVA